MIKHIISKHIYFFIALLCVSFIVRSLIFIFLIHKNDNAWIYPDSVQYQTAAEQLVSGHGMSNPDGTPQLYRLPGYPLFLAFCYKIQNMRQTFLCAHPGASIVLGSKRPSILDIEAACPEHSRRVQRFERGLYCAQWVQIAVASIIPIFIFLLSCVLFPQQPAIAYCASICSVIHVGFSIYASMIATETLFLLGLLIFLISFFARSKYYFLMGCILGAVSMIRPVGVYLIAIVLLDICVRILRNALQDSPSLGSKATAGKHDERDVQASLTTKKSMSQASIVLRRCGVLSPRIQAAQQIVFLCLGWLSIVSPWLIRNFMLTGCVFFHTLPGLHFLQYSAAYVLMERDACSYGDVRPKLLAEWDHAVKQKEQFSHKPCNEYERCILAEKIAYKYMLKHPVYTLKTAGVQILKTCCSLYTAQTLLSDSDVWPEYTRTTSMWTKIKRFLSPRVRNKILIPLIYLEILMYLFMALGLFSFICSGWWRMQLQSFLFIGMFIVITLAYGCARLRFPIEPFLIIFSGAGWIWMYSRICSKKSDF